MTPNVTDRPDVLECLPSRYNALGVNVGRGATTERKEGRKEGQEEKKRNEPGLAVTCLRG